MPIRKELKIYYPVNWQEISSRIRFQIAGGRCEHCRAKHGMYRVGDWMIDESALHMIPSHYKPVRIILSAAHLEHDPTKSEDEHLAALCQRCHLRHDARHHVQNRRSNLEAGAGQQRLFMR